MPWSHHSETWFFFLPVAEVSMKFQTKCLFLSLLILPQGLFWRRGLWHTSLLGILFCAVFCAWKIVAVLASAPVFGSLIQILPSPSDIPTIIICTIRVQAQGAFFEFWSSCFLCTAIYDMQLVRRVEAVFSDHGVAC